MSKGWDEIRLVTAPEELEKVYRFRYKIYVEEMQRPQADADHECKRIEDKLDNSAYNLAAFKGADIVGVVRVNLPQFGDVGYYEQLYEMGCVGADHPLFTSVITRLMINFELRNGTLAVRLACACFELGMRHQIKWAFIDCNEHLVDFFLSLGYVRYIAPKQHPDYGWVTPLRFDCTNGEYLKKCRSPLRTYFDTVEKPRYVLNDAIETLP